MLELFIPRDLYQVLRMEADKKRISIKRLIIETLIAQFQGQSK